MIHLTNEMAKLDILVVYQTSGSGVFNVDARRLSGLQHYLPIEMTDRSITFFKPLQDHFDLCRFGRGYVRVSNIILNHKNFSNENIFYIYEVIYYIYFQYSDFLLEGVPLMCFTFKDLQGRSGQITPVNNQLNDNSADQQQQGLFYLKSDLDICGNVVDLICYTKNKVIFILTTSVVTI